MTFHELNTLSPESCEAALLKCCGSSNWSGQMTRLRPFESIEELITTSDKVWSACTKSDALEAFSHHPKIGTLKNLGKKFASTKEWAGKEQAGAAAGSRETLEALAEGNKRYEGKFGFIFIICATGKSATEMLTNLEKRLTNDAETELRIASAEQNKITHLRLEKLLS
jgi:2-oxo-4-hydroxy-4-carboxy-5-ureidoimidazoline decarboxylase